MTSIETFSSNYITHILNKLFNFNNNNNNNNSPDLENIQKLFKILKLEINSINELYNIRIYHKTLQDPNLVGYFYNLIPNLKENYYSNKLTCLHKNSLDKQKFPGINLLRQILKCNNLKLSPRVLCKGYNPHNGKKLVERYFIIEDLQKLQKLQK